MRRSKRIIIRESQITRMFRLASMSLPFHFIARQTAKNITVKVISQFERISAEQSGYKVVFTTTGNTNDIDEILTRWKHDWRPAVWNSIRENPFFEEIKVDEPIPLRKREWGSGLI